MSSLFRNSAGWPVRTKSRSGPNVRLDLIHHRLLALRRKRPRRLRLEHDDGCSARLHRADDAAGVGRSRRPGPRSPPASSRRAAPARGSSTRRSPPATRSLHTPSHPSRELYPASYTKASARRCSAKASAERPTLASKASRYTMVRNARLGTRNGAVDPQPGRRRRPARQVSRGAGRAGSRARAAAALERGKVFLNEREVTLADAGHAAVRRRHRAALGGSSRQRQTPADTRRRSRSLRPLRGRRGDRAEQAAGAAGRAAAAAAALRRAVRVRGFEGVPPPARPPAPVRRASHRSRHVRAGAVRQK